MTPAELERLALLVEEAAEVQQIAMKIMRHGYGSYHPDDPEKTPNRELLNKELGDLAFAVDLMLECHDINEKSIDQHHDMKKEKIRPYLHHNTV